MWILIAIIVATIIIGELTRPKVQDNARASNLQDFNVPTADTTRPVPVVWGTVNLTSPNLVWFGDLQSVKLTKRIKTGLFSSQRLTIAFRYSIGMHLGLCHGPVELLGIITENKYAFEGVVTNGDFTVDARTIYGGDAEEQLNNGGEGGVYAECVLYPGTSTQLPDSYLEAVLSPGKVPANRGIAQIVWKGPSSGKLLYNYDLTDGTPTLREPFLSGYVGVNPQVKPMSFVVRRLPNFINAAYYNINNGDANPADVIYELIINKDFGLGLDSSFINTTVFENVQKQLHSEGLGWSSIWDSQKPVADVLEEILRFIDGVLYIDLEEGLITLVIARDDYDVDELLLVDDSVELVSFSRGAWDETANEIQVIYIDRFQKFTEKAAIAQDLANARIQESIVSSRIAYNGCSNSATAAKIAFRDLRTLATPLAKATIKMDREGLKLPPGKVFKLKLEGEDETILMRALRLKLGELENGKTEIDAVQDIFSVATGIYADAPPTSWTPIDSSATLVASFLAQEAPYSIAEDNLKIQTFCAKPDANQFSFNTYVAQGSSTEYTQNASADSFTPKAKLNASYNTALASTDVDAGTITVTPVGTDLLYLLQNFSPEYVAKGQNLFQINGEIKAFETVTKNLDGTYTLGKIWHGLLDTVPKDHLINSELWFFTYGDSITNNNFTAGTTQHVKVSSVSSAGISPLSTAQDVIINQRSIKPYAPGNFLVNGSHTATTTTTGTDIAIAWSHRNRVFQAENVYKQFDSSINVAEPRTNYILKFIAPNGTTVLRTVTLSNTVTSYTYTNANQVTDNGGTEPTAVTIQLYTERDGIYSLNCQQRTLTRSGTPTIPPFSPPPGSYVPPPEDDAVSIGGIRVCTTPPTNGQTLVYNSTNNCWEPGSVSVTLAGDVTGPSGANTVEKIRNRTVAATSPTANQFLGWNPTLSQWEPKTIASASSGSVAVTTFADTAETHTTNNTWEDIGDMTLAYTPPEISNIYCEFTCEVTGISSSNEHVALRFVLDGGTNSEVWVKSKDTSPSNNERLLVTVHTVFENVTANTSHSVKVQWQDNSSNLDVTILNRRLTMITCKSPYDTNFSPSLLSGLQYWFKASALTGLSNNDPVSSMTDFSGNGRHFNATSSPDTKGVYKTSQVNGLPAIQFTHDGNAFTTTNTTYYGPNFLTGFTEGEIFIVLKSAADPASSNLKGSYGTFGTDFNITHYPFTDGTVYDDFGSNVRKNTGNPSTNLSGWTLYNVSTKAGSWKNRINGTLFYSTTSNTVAWTTAPIFGGNASTDGDAGYDGMIAEVIIFNRELNSSERTNVRNYINSTYAV